MLQLYVLTIVAVLYLFILIKKVASASVFEALPVVGSSEET